MPVIKFVKEKVEIEVPSGANLRQEAIKAGVNVHQGVNGFGASINKVVDGHCCAPRGPSGLLLTKGMDALSALGKVEKLRFRCPVPTPVTPGGVDPVPCLAFVGNEETMRLACQCKVHGDVEVETGPELDLFGENFFS